jgi:hypothetical protein
MRNVSLAGDVPAASNEKVCIEVPLCVTILHAKHHLPKKTSAEQHRLEEKQRAARRERAAKGEVRGHPVHCQQLFSSRCSINCFFQYVA